MFAMAFFGEPDETAPAVDGRRQGELSRFVERERVRRRAGCRVARVRGKTPQTARRKKLRETTAKRLRSFFRITSRWPAHAICMPSS